MHRCHPEMPDLSWIPIGLGALSIFTFFLSYAIAVALDHVVPYFPYISDTGADSPESCIFGQFLNLAGLLSVMTMYIRYRLVTAFTRNTFRKITVLNTIALVLGVLSSLGLTIVANFQDNRVEVVHIIGAALVFGFGVIYTWFQVGLSFLMYPDYNALRICVIRSIMSAIATISMIMAFVSAIIARVKWSQSGDHNHDQAHWKPTDQGYDAHIVSTITEWVMAFSFVLFFLTYAQDFRKISLNVNVDALVNHMSETPVRGRREPNEASGLLANA